MTKNPHIVKNKDGEPLTREDLGLLKMMQESEKGEPIAIEDFLEELRNDRKKRKDVS